MGRSTGADGGSPRRARRSWAARRPEVLSTARRTFIASGYAGTTMRAIARAADVNEALLYRYFSSKEQLFAEAIAAPLEEAMNNILAPAVTQSDIERLTERFFHDLLDAMRELAPLLNVVLADEAQGREFYRRYVQPTLEKVEAASRANLESWSHLGFDPALATRVVYGTCWYLALDERFGDGIARTSEDLAPELARMLLGGLRGKDPRRAAGRKTTRRRTS